MISDGRPPLVQEIEQLKQFRSEFADGFERFLATLVVSDAALRPLPDAMNYSLLAGGKRLRPLLCCAVARLYGASWEQVYPAAAALEMIHAYSLIHDDLPCMDDDDLRRGKPTNHRVFGEAMALLAGDALLTQAFEVLSGSAVPPAITVRMVASLAHAAGPHGMVGGQVADMLGADGSLTKAQRADRLRFIHERKTGRLIAAAVDLGALIGGSPDVERQALAQFAHHIGQAFQMMDDWLDVHGTTEEIGKSVGSDELNEKLTYPAVFGSEETLKLAESEYAEALAALNSVSVETGLLRSIAQTMVRRRK